ncbi:MAG TPA: response regulator [Gemmataceae bacterium]|nr:response regulator [Gemmataceae bacterium]
MHDAAGVHPVEILLVEDNPGDVRLMREALHEGKMHNRLSVVEDGVEALAFLRQEGKYTGVPRPGLILLDLSLPRKNGHEVLVEIKRDAELKRIPVCVVTSSAAERDVLDAYNNHVNCYLTKPADLKQFITVVRSVEEFWLSLVKLPP